MPFSPERFSAAYARAGGVTLEPDRECRIQFDASGTRWFLAVAGGRITAWQPGSLDDADVELQWTMTDAQRIVARELRSDAAHLATTAIAPARGGVYTGPPAPVNLACRPELSALPVAKGATFGVQYRYRDGPFGAVDHVLRFEDGRVVEERLGRLDAADVTVEVTYRAMARVRAGEITIIEALEGGSVTGEIGPMGALAGISESTQFHDAELATGRHALALAVLGELHSDPTFADTARILAGVSHAP